MAAPDQVKPIITNLYATPLPTKRRALIVDQGQVAEITVPLLDYIGNPLDITPFQISNLGLVGSFGAQSYGAQGPQAPGYAVQARINEVISTIDQMTTLDCDVISANPATIFFEIPSWISNNPGVYFAEFGVFKLSDDGLSLVVAFTNKCFLWVDRGLFGTPTIPNAGPPTLDEVRLFIRDSAPEENLLLDDFEFDLADICQAAEMAVRYWNETNPPIGICFTTLSYPPRYKWLQAIAGHALITAAHRFRRNHLPYQSGGLSIDDQNKFQQYEQAGMMLMQEYREWVKQIKVRINCEHAITSQGSDYGAIAYRTLINTGV